MGNKPGSPSSKDPRAGKAGSPAGAASPGAKSGSGKAGVETGVRSPAASPSNGAAAAAAASALPVDDIDKQIATLDKPMSKLPLPEGTEIREDYYKSSFNHKQTVDDFELLKVIGKGSFGKVMLVRKRDTGRVYAMKVLKKAQLVARKQVAHTKTERKVLQEIDHPFIVSLRFAFQTQTKLYMILDYFTGGELFFHLKSNGRFAEERARFYAAEITMALECLHSNRIIYRDLKPENVLLDENGHIRLTDFGLSKEWQPGKELTHTFCGTPEYLAPEVIHGAGYGKAVDWWSLGTLLYEMMTGLPPFYNQNLHVMYEKIIRGKLNFPSYVSPPARSVLAALLERNPDERIGSGPGDGEEIKKHPFFAPIDFEKLYKKEIEAPFKPTITEGKLDVHNVDAEFTRLTPKDTPVADSGLPRTRVNFANFTYVGVQSNLAAQESQLAREQALQDDLFRNRVIDDDSPEESNPLEHAPQTLGDVGESPPAGSMPLE